MTYDINVKTMEAKDLIPPSPQSLDDIAGALPFSVSEVSDLIKGVLEQSFNNIQVRGEISEVMEARSGHVYFTIKDTKATLSVICWKYVFQSLKIRLEAGMEVTCRGKISSYPLRSNYQFIVTHIDIGGDGMLLKLFEERKQRLNSLGYFSPEKKQPIPKFPERICVITSETGAVIRDITTRIAARFPLSLYIYHCQVQGATAHLEVAKAIKVINESDLIKPDIIIIARGGGSLQDLWAFNEEEVVHAIYHSKIPIISAIGHETDFTLADFVADLRAPTPTAAAELATPNRSELFDKLNHHFQGVAQMMKRRLEFSRYNIESKYHQFIKFSYNLGALQQRFKELLYRAQLSVAKVFARYDRATKAIDTHALQRYLDKGIYIKQNFHHMGQRLCDKMRTQQQSLDHGYRLLNSLNPHHVLERGYTMVEQNSRIVTDMQNFNMGQNAKIRFKDGVVSVIGTT